LKNLFVCIFLGITALFVSSISSQALELSLYSGAKNQFYPDGYKGIEDVEILSSSPDSNTGGNWDAMIGPDASGARRLLLRWRLDKIATLFNSNKYVPVSARILMKEWYNGKVPNQQINVYRILPVNKDWIAGTGGPYNWDIRQVGSVTWKDAISGSKAWAGESGCGKPGVDYDSKPMAIIYANNDPRRPNPHNLVYIDVPITLIKSWAMNPENNAGLLLKAVDETKGDLSYFSASENPKLAADPYPKLILSFIDKNNIDTKAKSYIVKAGKAACVIILPVDASAGERFAAQELQEHIKSITGADLTQISENLYNRNLGAYVSIGRTKLSRKYVSDKQFTSLGNEGYRIFSGGGNTYIIGGRKRGSLYAVYEFLESNGVRWYSPEWTVIPKTASIKMPATPVEYKPVFRYRDQYWNNSPTRIWYARMRLNGEIAGIPDEMGGSSHTLLGCHSLEQLAPAKDLLEKHPDWFALKENGTRSKTESCLTNPELRSYVRDKVLEMIKSTNGWAEDIWVGQMDGSTDGCFCERCTAERKAHGGKDRWSANTIPFVNYIADAVRVKFPGVKVKTLAYSYTTTAPDNMKVADNVTIEICGNFVSGNDPHAKIVKTWSKIAKSIQVYTYAGSNSGYWWPYPNLLDMGMQYTRALQNGVTAFYAQGTAFSKGSGMVDLRAYLTARLGWDPSRNIRTEIKDFCNGFYGPGGKFVSEYVLSYADYAKKNKLDLNYMWGDADAWKKWITKDIMVKSDGLFQKALNATRNNPAYYKHVCRAYLEVLWGSVMVNLNKEPQINGNQYSLFPPAKAPEMQKRVKLFAEIMAETGYDMMQEYEPYVPGKSQLDIIAKDFKVFKLSNGKAEIWTVPSLGGRIVRWNIPVLGGNILKVSGGSNPYSSGYEELGSVPIMNADFKLESTSDRSLVMKAVMEEGVEATRTLTLDKNKPLLTISTVYKNVSDKQLTLNIRTRPELLFKLFRDFQFYTNNKDGKWIAHDLWSKPGPDGWAYYETPNMARPAWILANKAKNVGLINRFDASVIKTLYTYYGSSYGGINMEIWGNDIVLEPNQSWKLENSFEAVSDLRDRLQTSDFGLQEGN